MNRTILTLLSILLAAGADAQLISRFTWETSNTMHADFGPDATSISSYAVSSTGGSNNTNGLNPGASGAHDINMILPGASFMVSGLDISMDFRRKESDAIFFTLGNFEFGMSGGSLYSKLDLTKGSGDTIVNSGGVYSIPSDNVFHTYNFRYNNVTGVATLSVDGTVVYTYYGVASRNMYWTGATNVTVGKIMDATGSNIAVLDNLVVQSVVVVSVLPLTLLSFDAHSEGSFNMLNWTTIREMTMASIVVERAPDGSHYEPVGKLAPQDSYFTNCYYRFTDSLPLASSNYYRLRFVDVDGTSRYSDVKRIVLTSAIGIRCFPNPTIDQVNISINNSKAGVYRYSLLTIDGKALMTGSVDVNSQGEQIQLNVSALPKGLMIVQVQNLQDRRTETFKIVKR